MGKKAKPLEPVTGSYTPIPHAVLDSQAFTGASNRAKAMIFEFLRQHNGRNNGRMQATSSWLVGRGWRSKESISKAVAELVERSLLLLTKRGGLNAGPSWFALTWLPITDFSGLDIKPQAYWPGAWSTCDLPAPQTTRRVKKRTTHPDSRGSTDPIAGVGGGTADPEAGTKTAGLRTSTAPVAGNNECCQLPARNVLRKNRARQPLASRSCIRLVINNDRAPLRLAA